MHQLVTRQKWLVKGYVHCKKISAYPRIFCRVDFRIQTPTEPVSLKSGNSPQNIRGYADIFTVYDGLRTSGAGVAVVYTGADRWTPR